MIRAALCVAGAPAVAQTTELPKVEGAIGAIVSYGPEYPGAERHGVGLAPAFYVRYGRVTVSNSGGFVNRRSDDVLRGLGIDLVNRDRQRINLTLRIDRGRSESASDALRGMGDIPSTLRARMAGTWQFPEGWRAGASWTVDALGRGGGNLGDLTVAHEKRWSAVTVVTWSASLTLAGDRYLQTYFGVTPEQAARTGYAVYEPRFGLRDVALGVGLRTELGPHWAALAGLGASRLLGPAAASPLTFEPWGWSVNAGLAWRF